jgi:lipid-A-disaccharide synthase
MVAYPRIFISVGEHSGDRLGAALGETILQRAPDAQLAGLGGERMRAAGVRIVADTTGHAGMGVLPVLRHLGDWARAYRRAITEFNGRRPDIVVPIDNPGFNLGKGIFGGVCGAARERGIPVCYYVSPQVWAWFPWRIKRICRLVDRMMTVLPFEKELYDARGVDCRYVGHSVVDYLSGHVSDARVVKAIRDTGRPVIGLLPGSREQEIRRTFGIICGAALCIRRAFPEAAFHVAAVSGDYVRPIRAILEAGGLQARVHVGHTPEIMRTADLCLACSGTVTLETAYCGTPMVIVYRTSGWHRHVVPWFLNTRHIGLVNVVGGEEVVPEFLMFDDDPAPVADAALTLLRDPEAHAACRKRLEAAVRKLGGPGSVRRAADSVLDMLGR